MKKAQQEDAKMEAENNPAVLESSNADSKPNIIMVDSDKWQVIADFIERVDKLTDPNFKVVAEYVPSKELKDMFNGIVNSSRSIVEQIKNSTSDAAFAKVRSQIVEDVKKSQSNQRMELWVWRSLYALFGLAGVLWCVLELMKRYHVKSPMEVVLLFFGFIGWTYLFYKIGRRTKD